MTSAIKDSVATISGKSIKPHVSNHGSITQTKIITSLPSQSSDTIQNNKEVWIGQYIEYNHANIQLDVYIWEQIFSYCDTFCYHLHIVR